MSKLKNMVPCCEKVFKQKPDKNGYYTEPTKNQMIDKLLIQHEEIEKLLSQQGKKKQLKINPEPKTLQLTNYEFSVLQAAVDLVIIEDNFKGSYNKALKRVQQKLLKIAEDSFNGG